jgi:hypothetical protein
MSLSDPTPSEAEREARFERSLERFQRLLVFAGVLAVIASVAVFVAGAETAALPLLLLGLICYAGWRWIGDWRQKVFGRR